MIILVILSESGSVRSEGYNVRLVHDKAKVNNLMCTWNGACKGVNNGPR